MSSVNMFKKFIFSLILILFSHILAMEQHEKGKEKEVETPNSFEKKRLNNDEASSSTSPTRTSPRSIGYNGKRSSQEKYEILADLGKFNTSSEDLSLFLQSPRSPEISDCDLLNLADELLLLIIYQMVEEINFDDPNPQDETDQLYVKKVHNSLLPLMQSCRTMNAIIPEGIFTFYFIKLNNYSRPEKIRLVQESYTNKHLLSIAFLLTSMLRESRCDKLFFKNLFLKELVLDKSIYVDNQHLCFRLGSNEEKNLTLLTEILLNLISTDDNFITLNKIFETILSSSNNQKTLKHLVNLDILDHNDYISTELMRDSYNGNLEEFQEAVDNNPEQLFAETPNQFNVIIWVVIGGHPELLEYLFNNISIDQLVNPNRSNQNLVHYGSLYATSGTLKYILSKLDTLENFNEIINLGDNNSPLSMAIQVGSENKTLILIHSGASIESLVECEFPPYNGSSQMLKQLIENKSTLPKIAQELGKLDSNRSSFQNLSPEDIIKCCKKCRKTKNSLKNKVYTLAGIVICFILYGCEILGKF